MKLLLCSWAPNINKKLEKVFLDLLEKPVNENKIIMLSMDTTSPFFKEQINIVTKWYKQIGFQEKKISIHNLQTDTLPSFEDLDVLHMYGGNTYHYLRRTKEPELKEKINGFIERDGVYVGSSAGSNIMCPEVDPMLTGDVNDIGLDDLEGFGYFSYNIIVHWDTMNSHLRTDQIEYLWTSGKRVIPLTDQQAIQVLNKEWKILSPDLI